VAPDTYPRNRVSGDEPTTSRARQVNLLTDKQPIDGSPHVWNFAAMTTFPILRPQEIPLDDRTSCNMFEPNAAKPFVATPAAIEMYSRETILACLQVLQESAVKHGGLDCLQVFESLEKQEKLWFIEDGVITALLPSDD